MLDVQPAAPRLFAGAPAFMPRTPWGPWQGFLVCAAITLVSIIAAAILTAALQGPAGQGGGDTIGLLTLGVWQVLTLVLTVAAAAWGGRASEVLSLQAPQGAGVYLQALALLLILQIVATGLEYIFVPQEMFRDLRSFADIARGPAWPLGMLVVGIGAPLSEELLFRGFLFSSLARSRVGIVGAALISTTLWTSLHAGYSISGLIEIFVVGLFFSWLLWRTGSLRVTILCHAVYNSLIMLALRYLPLPSALLPA